jgi:hypothetical protein
MDALPRLAPVSDEYATLPVADAFNWADGGTELGVGEWYLVAFRSVRADGADEAKLDAYDERAHLEAAASPGFIHYLKGPRASDGTCMSFCLWQSRADARAAAGKPDHVRAVSLLDEMYESYTLEYLHVRRATDGPLTFEPYPTSPHAFGHHGVAPAATDPLAPELGALPVVEPILPPLVVRPAPAS